MNDQGTRVAISATLQVLLKERVYTLRRLGYKGVTLSTVIEELCNKALFTETSLQPIGGHEQEGIKTTHKGKMDSSYGATNEQSTMRNEILDKEKRLMAREKYLDEREQSIMTRSKQYLDHYEGFQKAQIEIVKLQADKDWRELVLKSREEQIEHLKKDIAEYIREANKQLKEIQRTQKTIEIHTEKNFIEKYFPYASLALQAVILFNINKLANQENDFSIQDIMSKVKSGEIKEPLDLWKFVDDYLKKKASKGKGEKK